MPEIPSPSPAAVPPPVAADGARLDFLAFHGGPFFELQKSLGLIHERAFHTRRRVVMFVSLAWGVPLLVTLPNLFLGGAATREYLLDPGPGARFLLAISAFVIAEQSIETRLRRKLWQFTSAPLIAPGSMLEGTAALGHALRLRDSRPAEYICLALAAAAGIFAYASFSSIPASTWSATIRPDGPSLTLAGWWCVCVSIPIFVFLLSRGVWRHLVWAKLLRALAQLDLCLVSTHPDGKGGLAFIGDYPNAYVLYVFGVSCAVAAAVGKHMMQSALSATTLTTLMAAWLLLVLGFFAYPLSAFSRPLSELKERSLQALSAHATAQQRNVERKALGANIAAPGTDDAQQTAELADVTKQYDQARKLSTILLNRNALLPVAATALVPFAVTGASQLPFKEVLSVLKKLLLM